MSVVKAIKHAVKYITNRTSFVPDIAIVLGSGMGGVVKCIDGVSFAYSDIPGFLPSTVPTHEGYLYLGRWSGRNVVVMQGRLHRYEGYTAAEVVFPVRVMAALGATTLLMTNAAGSLRSGLDVGDLLLVEDHLSLANLAGDDPGRFGFEEELGSRFTSLNGAYSQRLMSAVEKAANGLGEEMPERGTYAYVTGPSFETPAEIRMLQQFGCDIVGMSTVPEVLAARQAGMELAVISAITNVCVSSVNDSYHTNEVDIFSALERLAPRVEALLSKTLPLI